MAGILGLRDYGAYGDETSDSMLELCLNAAKEWLLRAGVAEPSGEDALYDLAAYRLAVFYVERRGMVDFGVGTDAAPQGVQGIVHQLRDGVI